MSLLGLGLVVAVVVFALSSLGGSSVIFAALAPGAGAGAGAGELELLFLHGRYCSTRVAYICRSVLFSSPKLILLSKHRLPRQRVHCRRPPTPLRTLAMINRTTRALFHPGCAVKTIGEAHIHSSADGGRPQGAVSHQSWRRRGKAPPPPPE